MIEMINVICLLLSFYLQKAAPNSPKSIQETQTTDANVQGVATTVANDEEITELLRQLQDARNQRAREQTKVSELSQQLTTLLQENSALEEQLTVWRNKAQDVKNLQDEINTLEEVRCVRAVPFASLLEHKLLVLIVLIKRDCSN